ncbi:MAG: gliding motility-associated ABC transporter ATP-binding subunit GldA [Microscillaceae bacterium]|nr:gliding motility-associated ABC transporter ATP-binding subunit GldA [Microscillaceae bacterium]MDW8461232.1 gliding motility-associated ABC transporter ATP-binding subunit GldA [Cytophagales bacterium]
MSIIVENLSKHFGKQKAVDNISFEVKTGEIVGFLGPNGAGKSTTMKMATGYLTPTSGTIKVNGFDVQKETMLVKQSIGYLPEHNPLYLDMYVKEYLGFVAELHHIKQKKQRISEMIELCGLVREQHKKIGSLSKGYRQRVGLAQALIHNPSVLILDEPTTGLDPNQIVEIRELIKNVGKQKTVIFSTHLMQEVQAVCQRAMIIHVGKIVANASINELKNLTTGQTTIIAEFAQSIDKQALADLENVLSVQSLGANKYQIQVQNNIDIRPKIFQLAAEKQWILVGLQQQETSLEAVFQALTK